MTGVQQSAAQPSLIQPRAKQPGPVGRFLRSPLGLTLTMLSVPLTIAAIAGPDHGLGRVAWFVVTTFLVYLLGISSALAGQVLTGHLVGFRLLSWIAGPIEISRDRGKLCLDVNSRWSRFGGFTTGAPRSNQRLRARLTSYVLGGTLTGLLVSLGAFLVSGRLDGQTQAIQDLSAVATVLLPVIMIWRLVTREAPLLWLLWRGGPAAERLESLFLLEGAMSQGIRPREWDALLVEKATALHDASICEASSNYLAYYYALDRGDLTTAAQRIDRALTIVDGWASAQRIVVFRHAPELAHVYAEAAYFDARYRQDHLPHSRVRFAEERPSMYVLEDIQRAQAAIALADGDRRAASDAALRALSELDQPPIKYSGITQAEREWLEDLIHQIDQPEFRPPIGSAHPATPPATLSIEPLKHRQPSAARRVLLNPVVFWFSSLAIIGLYVLLPALHMSFTTVIFILAVLAQLIGLSFTLRELGRAGTGRLAGFRIRVLTLGVVQMRWAGGFRVELADRWSEAWAPALILPPREGDLCFRMAAYLAGGPISGAVGVIGIVGSMFTVTALVGVTGAETVLYPFWVALWLALPSAIFAPLLPLPFQDGPLIVRLLRATPRGRHWAALSALEAEARAGYRPRDWCARWVEQALTYTDGSLEDTRLQRLAYLHALDQGDTAQAALYLQRMIAADAATSALLRVRTLPYKAEAAYFEARHNGNPRLAAAWLNETRGTALPDVWLLAEAAIQLANGDLALAEERARQGLTLVAREAEPGIAVAEREWLLEIVETAAHRRENPTPIPTAGPRH